MEVERYEHGVPSWVDLGTPDIPKAIEFYSGLFGWQIEPGKIAVVQDPQGAFFNIITLSPQRAQG